MNEYPVRKKPVPVGKILNFRSAKEKYEVVESDGIQWGEKGFTLICKCVESPLKEKVGEEYHFDDRVWRDYNENDIVVEVKKRDEPKGVSIIERSWYTEVKGMTVNRAEKSALIAKFKGNWDKYFVSPSSGKTLEIREVGSDGKIYHFIFGTALKMREFNTVVFWGNGYK